MDNMRLAISALGKLLSAQISVSEFVNKLYNDGMPADLSGDLKPNPEYGLKGASDASELLDSDNLLTSIEQLQRNQGVEPLGLVSARKSEEAIETFKVLYPPFW
ncbi:hypothetical protein Mapa_005595 [Marchantia paleacea]|nr:hypothetical protein Mapa_005595 [Marchantia paleacea]